MIREVRLVAGLVGSVEVVLGAALEVVGREVGNQGVELMGQTRRFDSGLFGRTIMLDLDGYDVT